jgi:hypothetical protein
MVRAWPRSRATPDQSRAILAGVRFYLTPPDGTLPTLVVETRAVVDDAAIAELSADIYGLSCPNGILFDEHRCVILRDTFASMDESSVKVDAELATAEVLSRIAAEGSLDHRVERWLDVLAASWDEALPHEPSIAAKFIPDIVSAASGSSVYALGSATSRAS